MYSKSSVKNGAVLQCHKITVGAWNPCAMIQQNSNSGKDNAFKIVMVLPPEKMLMNKKHIFLLTPKTSACQLGYPGKGLFDVVPSVQRFSDHLRLDNIRTNLFNVSFHFYISKY